MSRTVTTTTTKEYDEEGRLVKETTVTSETSYPDGQVYTYPSPYPSYTITSYPSTASVKQFSVIDGGGEDEPPQRTAVR